MKKNVAIKVATNHEYRHDLIYYSKGIYQLFDWYRDLSCKRLLIHQNIFRTETLF